MLDDAMLSGRLQTVFGWPQYVGAAVNPRSLRNFPMQANGAEMLRLACCMATEEGIELCAPIHDAVLIAAPLDVLDDQIARMQAIMAEASRIVLAGFELGTDASAVRYPDRYMDERGTVMWHTVTTILHEIEAECRLRQHARRVQHPISYRCAPSATPLLFFSLYINRY